MNFRDHHCKQDNKPDSFSPQLSKFRKHRHLNLDSRRIATAGLIGALGLAAIGIGFPASQYAEGWGDKEIEGRTKNSLSAVVSGIVAEKAFGSANIDLELNRSLWPDSSVRGTATPHGIDSTVDRLWHPARFTAAVEKDGRISGNVDKIEFDWKLTPVSGNQWTIERFGLKFDYTLTLNVGDGTITGHLDRPGVSPDFEITGTYSSNGQVHISIDPSVGMSVELNGTITPQR